MQISKTVLIFFLLHAMTQPLRASIQFAQRQIPVYVTAHPHKSIYTAGKPILVDVEIKNGLKEEIQITAYTFSPNEWNGEVLCVELHDIYRVPTMFQIRKERPDINPPMRISGAGYYAIAAGRSKIKTIDVSKWKVEGGWIAGKYQLAVRVDKIDIDEYSWISVRSDPITIEVR